MSHESQEEPESQKAKLDSPVLVNSVVYRWLTAKPNHRALEIDLRETYIVAPFVAAFGWMLAMFKRAAGSSLTVVVLHKLLAEFRRTPFRIAGMIITIICVFVVFVGIIVAELSSLMRIVLVAFALAGLAGTRDTTSLEELQESQLAHLLVKMFEPPQSVESSTNHHNIKKNPEKEIRE